jgi:predicted alpha-1,6-mannanase (GH76 family)
LADYESVSNTTQYNSILANTFVQAPNTNAGFINNYYDDEGWWALAWIDAYDLTGNKPYLTMAESIFADMQGGWDSTCGGGIWWSKDKGYKNAIANELFLSVAAHLANRDSTNAASYLKWANQEWSWFAQSGLINSKNLINDGLGSSSGQTTATSCANNGQTTWSYNQGVILGGLVELAKQNTDATIPKTAQTIASAATTLLVDSSGVLHDSCEPNCGNDGVQFKGIFARNLATLDLAYPQTAYKTFLTVNANSIWNSSQGTNYEFGQDWSGPFDTGNAGSQSSALDAIIGAAAVTSAQ